MNRVSAHHSRCLVATLCFALLTPSALAKAPSFQVQLGEDGETIGEIRPVFMELEKRPLPAISVKEVARRYKQLFEEAEEPEVRVDALHRLNNLQAIAGDVLDFTPEQERELYQRALDSYEMIVSSGVYYGRLDELLYQTAKAYAFIGEDKNTVKRLEQLVGLYPNSEYATEARFRIAEYKFSSGDYDEAARAYRDILQSDPDSTFADKSLYMLGWSQFKKGARDTASRTFIKVLDNYYAGEAGFEDLSKIERNTVGDTFRILSIIAAYEGGADRLNSLLSEIGPREYDYLLYDRLADYYLANERYMDSVEASRAFVERNPSHPQAPAMAIQAVQALDQGRFHDEARQARRDFVQRYGGPAEVARLTPENRDKLLDYLETLGQWHYRTAQVAKGDERQSNFRQAAEYLERFTEVSPKLEPKGENLVLAADAWVEAGNVERALPLYVQAAYDQKEFEGASDAGYAAVSLLRERWKQDPGKDNLEALAEAGLRYSSRFSDDPRASDVRAYVANRIYEDGQYARAVRVARPLATLETATAQQQRAAWLILADVAYRKTLYSEAERDYRQALKLAGDDKAKAAEIRKQLAASVYQQGQQADEAGRTDEAVAHYLRLEQLAAGSELAIQAKFDAANALLKAERWNAAINALQSFRSNHPESEFAERIPEKLIYAYRQSHEPARAAEEILASIDEGLPASKQWEKRLEAAELMEQGDKEAEAVTLYTRFLEQAPASVLDHGYRQEVRHKLLVYYQGRDEAKAQQWRERLVASETQARGERTQRTRLLASKSALVLAQGEADRVRAIPLSRPLKKSIARKKEALKRAVERYQQAQSFGLAPAVTESTYELAELYRQLARDLMDSERPEGLSDMQRQQYDLLLEEQAYPFEEKAIALHEKNQSRIRDGLWNEWIDQSLDALASLFPARYARETRWMEWSDRAL
ncbi:tetratricopeptide repeat protein [Marinobacteraceae bacterium S3BR75-40.1]